MRVRGLDQDTVAGLALLKARSWIATHMPVHSHSLLPKTCKDGVLIIHAQNAIALQECTERAEQCVAWLHNELPQGIRIHSIRCTRAR